MAKKKTTKSQEKALSQFFDIHFFIEGGTSVWLQECAESRAAMERRIREVLESG